MKLQLHESQIMSKIDKYCETVLNDLNQFGICVIDSFLENEIANEILMEVITLYSCGRFKEGQLVNNKANEYSRGAIRGDQITWVDGAEEENRYVGFLMQTLDSIVMKCNKMVEKGGIWSSYKINRRTKAMVACYPGNGTKYVRHVDNPNQDGRIITSIYYLNKDYDRQRDGGILRLFPEMNSGTVADIEPRFDRVIFFWSDRRNPHEVQPSFRIRFAITVWYFNEDERDKALLNNTLNTQQKHPIQPDNNLRPFLAR